jgi:hypothetical protein
MKPFAAVVVEDTVFDSVDTDLMSLGAVVPGVRERLIELRETHVVVLVTPFARTDRGLRILEARLHEDRVPYDEVWCGNGLPVTDRRYDNGARKL